MEVRRIYERKRGSVALFSHHLHAPAGACHGAFPHTNNHLCSRRRRLDCARPGPTVEAALLLLVQEQSSSRFPGQQVPRDNAHPVQGQETPGKTAVANRNTASPGCVRGPFSSQGSLPSLIKCPDDSSSKLLQVGSKHPSARVRTPSFH
jgi:hypothetical protein